MLDLFDKGGPVMYALFAVSIYVTAVVLYKLYQFWKLKLNQHGFFQEILQHIQSKNFEEAMRLARGHHSLLAKVAATALACRADGRMQKEAKENEISLHGTNALRQLESHMRGLEISGTVAPLLGLLGTVTGMVSAFATLENAGAQVDPSVLAGGIWEALLTTVAGLVIAIPAVALHAVIDSRIETFRHRMEEVTTRILHAV